ncbi:fumarylacetoacetate hydrolase family protein [Burkholderia gladioli]|uniref:fumarylacetoacetate hydrolase family protein n=1 Tax=Burkholderia gladioli TaxID=28095 RepID=UPI000F80CB0D|nr:fumarylacetoacetate hydrolase family protein [Burkholderia gladioli]
MQTFNLLTYETADSTRPGVSVGSKLYDLNELLGSTEYPTTLSVVQSWDKAAKQILDRLELSPTPLGELNDFVLRAPIRPQAVYCVGANYRAHVKNMEAANKLDVEVLDGTLTPWFFLKTSHTITGPGDVVNPCTYLDWEGELAAIIGNPARNVEAADALKYVAGYTVSNDLSARDFMFRDKSDPQSPFYYDWVSQKNFDQSCAIGPWIVPATAVPDPQKLSLVTTVNGKVRQNATTSDMIYTLAQQISFLSNRFTLYPGDLILTGTPNGVGMETGERLATSDIVTVAIDGIGELTNTIR